jgi:hypothetical protein
MQLSKKVGWLNKEVSKSDRAARWSCGARGGERPVPYKPVERLVRLLSNLTIKIQVTIVSLIRGVVEIAADLYLLMGERVWSI